MIGRQVGRFRIVAKLGEGGMGSVWRAEDPLLGRLVALKFLTEGAETPSTRRRFLREARATSALEHPGIATVFEAGEFEGRLYIAMALVDGETISDQIAAGPMPLAEAARIAAEAADALEHAHTKGIVHRDISSRNIMRARDGRAVVIDFGLATLKDATNLSSSGAGLGTFAYMSPEVFLGKRATRLSDLYGLGVVLYEMVTGRLPFTYDQNASMMYAILNTRPAAPRELRADLSAAFERLILKCVAKEPAKRYPSTAELAEALRAVRVELDPAQVRAKAATEAAGATPTTKRRRAAPGELPEKKVLAVLPFRHLAGDEIQAGAEEFARGLAEALSASLARVPKLQIFPPGQPSASDEPDADPQAAAKRLGANLVLTGHVRRAGGQIRVSYSVIDARNGSQWAGDQVEGAASDLLALEDALVGSVVKALRVQAGSARRVQPLDAGGHERYLRALGHLQRRDSEKEIDLAMELLESLVVSEGDTAPVHAALARAYHRKAVMTFRPDWRAKAEASCRIALSLDPHSPDVLVMLARLRVETGHMDEALDALRQSMALQGQNLDALFCLVQVHESRSQFKEAESAALEAVTLRPEYWLAHTRLALLYFRSGQFHAAAESWRRAADLVPDNEFTHSNLGAALFHLGKCDESIAAYRRSLEIHPQASAYIGLGTVLFFSGERKESLEMFEKATSLRPADPRTWGNLADAQRWTPGYEVHSTSTLDKATALLRHQLTSNPEDPEAWSQLAKCLAKRGRRSESVEAIETALKIAPNDVSCQARAVTVYHLAGNRGAALRYFRAAVQAGYSRIELCRDPELEELRQDPEAQKVFTEDSTSRAGTHANEPQGGR